MTTIFIGLLSIFSTAAFIILWFFVVEKELHIKLDIVKSAKAQLTACEKNLSASWHTPNEEKIKGVYIRSLDIYHQAVVSYPLLST